jgi:hypothetical protein
MQALLSSRISVGTSVRIEWELGEEVRASAFSMSVIQFFSFRISFIGSFAILMALISLSQLDKERASIMADFQ